MPKWYYKLKAPPPAKKVKKKHFITFLSYIYISLYGRKFFVSFQVKKRKEENNMYNTMYRTFAQKKDFFQKDCIA